MDIIELFLDEENENSGIEAISVVESPAIESDFIALKNQEIKMAEVDKEKRILMGEIWNDYVKTGKVKGFSIEGFFSDQANRPKEQIEEELEANTLLNKIKNILSDKKTI